MSSQNFLGDVKTVQDAFNGPLTVEHLVDGFLPKAAFILLVGDSSAGKTSTSVAIAVYVAAGLNFLGLATQQAPALLIDEEMGPKMMGMKIVETVKGANTRINIPLFWTSMDGVDFSRDAAVRMWEKNLRDVISAIGAKLVVLDALQEMIPGKSDSKTEDVTPLMSALLKISRDLDVTVILIHHWNKQSPTYRGSTAIKGMVDVLINVKKSGQTITFEIDKNRFGEKKSYTAVVDWSNGMFTITGVGSLPKNQMQQLSGCPFAIVEAMQYIGGGGTFPKILQGLRDRGETYAEGTVRNKISELSRNGIVTRTDSGGKGSEATYMLTAYIDPFYSAMNPIPVKDVP
jgi:KaiC/GvpD/RAD55 family RecA-like ATPase